MVWVNTASYIALMPHNLTKFEWPMLFDVHETVDTNYYSSAIL